MNRQAFGLAAAIVIPAATSGVLIQRSSATGSLVLSGSTLWFIAWLSLAIVSVVLGRAMSRSVVAAAGVVVLGLSLGAILKAANAPDAIGATLIVTVAFVMMVAAAAGFHATVHTPKLAIACTFWLLGACILAGSTWNCAICGGAARCRIFSALRFV